MNMDKTMADWKADSMRLARARRKGYRPFLFSFFPSFIIAFFPVCRCGLFLTPCNGHRKFGRCDRCGRTTGRSCGVLRPGLQRVSHLLFPFVSSFAGKDTEYVSCHTLWYCPANELLHSAHPDAPALVGHLSIPLSRETGKWEGGPGFAGADPYLKWRYNGSQIDKTTRAEAQKRCNEECCCNPWKPAASFGFFVQACSRRRVTFPKKRLAVVAVGQRQPLGILYEIRRMREKNRRRCRPPSQQESFCLFPLVCLAAVPLHLIRPFHSASWSTA